MAAVDKMGAEPDGLESPCQHAEAVTPSDTVDLTSTSRALYIGGTGNVKITTARGDTVTLTNVLAGVYYPLRITRVWSTGTTATNMTAWS